MTEHRETIITILQILSAVGILEGFRIGWKYLFTNKKDKTKSISELYSEFTKNTADYMKQTEEMQTTITELRNSNLEMQRKMFEMNKKLDDKNEIITSLKEEITTLTEKIIDNTKVITDLIQRTEVLENIKCERDGCENRIPPKKSVRISKAKA